MNTLSSRLTDRQFFLARKWSNHEIRKLGTLFTGDAINVSGWDDRDKEGGRYRNYFARTSSYSISNYSGERGTQGTVDGIFLDLEAILPDSLKSRFDLVFNHTTLEHVFDMRRAFSNLCAMSRDAVLIVVPWAQVAHPSGSFGDYWRFSPEAVKRLFEAEGFSPLYISGSPMSDAATYVLGLGVRDASRWADRSLPKLEPMLPLGSWIGAPGIGFKIFRRLGVHKILGLAPRAPD